jgi:hypothetical protein
LVGRLWETQRGVGAGWQGGRRAAGGGHCAGLLLLASTLSKVPDRAHTRITLLLLPTYTTYTYLMIIPVRTAPLSFLGLHVSDTALSGGVVGSSGDILHCIHRWVGMYVHFCGVTARSRQAWHRHSRLEAGSWREGWGAFGHLRFGGAVVLVRWCARPNLGG